MKKALTIVLAVFATSALAVENSLPTGPQSAATHDVREPSLAITSDQPGRIPSATSQVFYQVTLSRDGKVLKSFNLVTDNGKQVTATSEETVAYLASCDAADGCSTGAMHSGLSLSLTPRVGADGVILTSCKVDLQTLSRADDLSSASDFFTYRGQEMTISHNGLLLTIKAKVA
jgi:hypothetical protein